MDGGQAPSAAAREPPPPYSTYQDLKANGLDDRSDFLPAELNGNSLRGIVEVVQERTKVDQNSAWFEDAKAVLGKRVALVSRSTNLIHDKKKECITELVVIFPPQ